MYDYVIVGCGMYGTTFARRAADLGASVLMVDKRTHVGGNCYTTSQNGIHVHQYGAHIFHTNDERVWRFLNRFARFNGYRHRVLVSHQDRVFSFPISLTTLEQLWGIADDAAIVKKLDDSRVQIAEPANFQEWMLSQVGEEIYEVFFRGYTRKQWGRDPHELPASIAKRIPIRLNRSEDYFSDRFQGIPEFGYTQLFESMLDHPRIQIELGTDYFDERHRLDSLSRKIVYSGPIDRFFDYQFGRLSYRSLRFESTRSRWTHQPTSVMNFTDETVSFTRVIEHKHFMDSPPPNETIVTKEYPDANDAEPYYPVRDIRSIDVLQQYLRLTANSGALFGGRLGTYQYFDMHQVVAQALAAVDREYSSNDGKEHLR